MGIAKKFKLPWGREGGHTLELRLEAFNVTNTQRMGSLTGGRTGYGIGLDPAGEPAGCSGAACVVAPLTAPTIWSNFNAIQGKPREMQFGAIYRF